MNENYYLFIFNGENLIIFLSFLLLTLTTIMIKKTAKSSSLI